MMFPKPAPKRRESRAGHSASVRAEVFEREHGCCRVPWCLERAQHLAHLRARGMGGDRNLRTTPENCVAVCAAHHNGPRSMHSGHVSGTCDDPERGANGPMTWVYREQPGRHYSNNQE